MKTTNLIKSKALGKLCLLLLTFSLTITLSAQFSGGDGSQDNPYIVGNAEDLDNVRNFANSNFIQRGDIDLDVPPWNEGEGWLPIATFGGYYDGNGHIIDGLYINRPGTTYQGLFARASGDGTVITNLGVTNVDITGGNSRVGAIVGNAANSVVVIKCFSTGTVRGSGERVGGLIGNLLRSETKDSYSLCEVRGEGNRVGGLVGEAFDSFVTNCFSTGNVTGSGEYTAGLVGYNVRSPVANCYSTGNVEGDNYVAGLVGYMRERPITNSYSISRLTGNENIGGLVADDLRADYVNSYWNTESSGVDISVGGEGRTTEQMTHPFDDNTYVDWDFEEIWTHDAAISRYPVLQYQESDLLDTPQITATKVTIDDVKHIRLSWDAIDHAQSYRIYASDELNTEDWGDPVDIVSQTEYSEPFEEDVRKFYYVVACEEEAP